MVKTQTASQGGCHLVVKFFLVAEFSGVSGRSLGLNLVQLWSVGLSRTVCLQLLQRRWMFGTGPVLTMCLPVWKIHKRDASQRTWLLRFGIEYSVLMVLPCLSSMSVDALHLPAIHCQISASQQSMKNAIVEHQRKTSSVRVLQTSRNAGKLGFPSRR